MKIQRPPNRFCSKARSSSSCLNAARRSAVPSLAVIQSHAARSSHRGILFPLIQNPVSMADSRPLTVLCITTYEKGQEFMRQCKRQGCSVILLTAEKLKDAD